MSEELIGERLAFPRGKAGTGTGMTYRQWLIGQALAGASAHPTLADPAGYAIEVADDVLTKLESERTPSHGQ